MAQPFLGQIMAFGGSFAPQGYLPCDGRSLPISQFDALYSLLGTTYGGDGVNTFNIPALQSRVANSLGAGPGLGTYVAGQQGGVENVTLTAAQNASHTHPISAAATATSNKPLGNLLLANEANSTARLYLHALQFGQPCAGLRSCPQQSVLLAAARRTRTVSPFLAITYCIAIDGIYPSQN